jgi:anthranilate phosphoribosyltransferase
VLAVLDGTAPPTTRAAVLLNAAAAVMVAGGERSFVDALARVTRALEDGDGLAALERLRRAYAPAQ